MKVKGIHHISSTVGQAQRNIDFYAGMMGLRLVKNTLNYDDMDTFHFYYGNKNGSTGLVTTFPIADAEDGVIGGGQVASSIYSVPKGSLAFWKKHLEAFNIKYTEDVIFGAKRLLFNDIDELALEFVESDFESLNPWVTKSISAKEAFIGIHSAQLNSMNPEETEEVLVNILGYTQIDDEDNRVRYRIHDGLGGEIELNKNTIPMGRMGKGTVHHIAFEIEDGSAQAWSKYLTEKGYKPTEVKDRHYFQSIYFREPGGILIELATSGPGVLVDQSLEDLGNEMVIPEHFLQFEEAIRQEMMPIFVNYDLKAFGEYGYRNRAEYDLLNAKKEVKSKLANYIKLSKERSLTEDELVAYKQLKQDYLQLGRKGR